MLCVFQLTAIWIGGKPAVDLSGRVEAAFESMPDRLESDSAVWLQNRVVPIPSNQEEILRLTASVSREYARLGTYPPVTATLFFAFCEDARWMVGHNPPVCYPASGWTMHADETQTRRVIHSDFYAVEYSAYRFTNSDLELAVVSGFISAPSIFTAGMEEAKMNVRPSLLGGQGLCQFQILFQGAIPGSDLHQYAAEILRGIPRMVFDAVSGDSGSLGGDRRGNGVES